MAVVNVLPNGHFVITLSPREAVMLKDEILDPSDFPWQSSESQIVAMEVKSQIKSHLDKFNSDRARALSGMIPEPPP